MKAGFLFNSARNGNVSAQIFWLKTRARWRETPMEHEITSKIDVTKMSDAELERRIAFLAGQMERKGENPNRIFPLAGIDERKK